MREFLSVITLLCLGVVDHALNAEEHSEFFGGDEIEVTTDQEDMFFELQNGQGLELSILKDQYEEMQGVVEKKSFAYETARLAILTDEQRKNLSDMRRERLRAERKTQLKLDLEFLRQMAAIMPKLEQPATMTVLEGKPRITSETPSKNGDSRLIMLHGFEFYEKPLVLSDDQQFTLLSKIQDYRSYEAFSGGKMCGGFHPDALVRLNVGNEQIDIMICLGCAESKVLSDTFDVKFDLTENSYDTFRRTLSECFVHRKRP